VLALHLAVLLRFTAWLELNPVLQVCRSIFENAFPGLALAEPTRQTALYIMGDEVNHTDLCSEYLRSLEQSMSLPDLDIDVASQRRLDALINGTPDDLRHLAVLAYVLSSETTITAALEVAPQDYRVKPRIRELLRDHAEDERRHQAYFSAILRSLWTATPLPDQRRLASLLVRALETFLWPDASVLTGIAAFVEPNQAAEISERVLRSSVLREELRTSAEPMLAVLREVGAFRQPEVVDVFSESIFEFERFQLEG
jgi:hypothetical protein